ncbi:SDR family NAD(P)-dependent oxidoreductase [Candidatus Poriferisocius sp.]|uniref:SDR family NAD(P)-dependent oxidoreductase n=1 Tax=Candidatus Poriferisocius sp. TaxID=3101276 RepID=UPI003B516D73
MASSPLRFDGRTAIVTGAGQGLGRDYALLLAERGARVVVNDIAAQAADGVVDEITAAGGTAVADHHSVTTPEGGVALAEQAQEALGPVHIVINNAGVNRAAEFSAMTPESGSELFGEMIAIHLLGPCHVLWPLWPAMVEQGYGRVVNIASGAVWGLRGQAAYAACKAGVMGLTRTLAREGRYHGVQVNCALPWAVTDQSPDRSGEEFGPIIDTHITPENVAPAVIWLAHEECPSTGESFTVDGPRMARLGWVASQGHTDLAPTPESYRDHWDEVIDLTNFTVPKSTNDHMRNTVMPAFAPPSPSTAEPIRRQ